MDLDSDLPPGRGGLGSAAMQVDPATGVAAIELLEEQLAEQVMKAESPRFVPDGYQEQVGHLE